MMMFSCKLVLLLVGVACPGDAALRKEILKYMEAHPSVARFAVSLHCSVLVLWADGRMGRVVHVDAFAHKKSGVAYQDKS
jgi:hypothetical protein